MDTSPPDTRVSRKPLIRRAPRRRLPKAQRRIAEYQGGKQPVSRPRRTTSLLSYLDRPELSCQPLGNHANGEIEIIRDAAVVRAWASRSKQKGKQIGVVYEDPYILVVRDCVRFPNGSVNGYVRIIEKSEDAGITGVVVVPVFQGFVYFCKIYRHALRSWSLELPRGMKPPQMSPEAAGELEVREELLTSVHYLKPLGRITPNTGLLSGEAQAFWAELVSKPLSRRHRRSEAIKSLVPVRVSGIRSLVARNQLRDAYSISSLFLASAAGLLPDLADNHCS